MENKQKLNRQIKPTKASVQKSKAAAPRAKGNMGKGFERAIEESNALYERRGQALVFKVPTATRVFTKNNVVTGAHFHKATAVDFVGVAHGRAVAFEAKETAQRNNFPLKNFRAGQVEFLKTFKQQGGAAFALIYFSKLFETYLIDVDAIVKFLQEAENGGVKSIPYGYFVEQCERVTHKNLVQIDWLTALNKEA